MQGIRMGGGLVALALALGACGDGDGKGALDADASAALPGDGGALPTWYQDIQPIVHVKCGGCHRAGSIGPFSVEDYASAKPMAALMASAVERGTMPPWGAAVTDDCKPRHAYADDPRLSDDEKALLRAWAEGGAPEGDAASAAALEEPPSVEIERADLVLGLPEPIEVEETGKGDLHTCLILDPEIGNDTYVVSRQITSGNAKVLHHVVQYVVAPTLADGTVLTTAEMSAAIEKVKGVGIDGRYPCFGSPDLQETGLTTTLLGSWAPGGQPVTSPPDSGQPVKAGSLIVLDMHYHPLAQKEVDSDTTYALQFADGVPRYVATPVFMGYADPKQPVHADSSFGTSDLLLQDGESEPALTIPAGAKDHVEEWTFKWKLPYGPIKVYFSSSHMHFAGRNLRVTIEHADAQPDDAQVECLHETPAWDFNWQLGYSWDTDREGLPTLHDGDTIRVRCVYDNTLDNRFIATALADQGLKSPVDVHIGEDTLDEMCLSLMGITYENPALYQ